MFERFWINKIHPALKQIIIYARRDGMPVSYNPFSGLVTINYGPLASRVYDAKTGQLIIIS
ncbi:MAG: hypothetical protein LBB48_07430 [Treponema sp.]|jgi:hypothetical protein|nr:hypothetical protein [Treponema sp.]